MNGQMHSLLKVTNPWTIPDWPIVSQLLQDWVYVQVNASLPQLFIAFYCLCKCFIKLERFKHFSATGRIVDLKLNKIVIDWSKILLKWN